MINKEQLNACGDDEPFATKIISDIARQLPEMYNRMEELHIKEAKILEINNELQNVVDTKVTGVKESFEALEIRQRINGELAKLRDKLESLENQEKRLRQESKRLPALEQQFHNARNVYNSERAARLGIVDWDDTLPQEEQAGRIIERISEIFTAIIATEPRQQETVRTNLATIERQPGIIPDNENNPDARSQSLPQHLKQQAAEVEQEYFRQPGIRTEAEK